MMTFLFVADRPRPSTRQVLLSLLILLPSLPFAAPAEDESPTIAEALGEAIARVRYDDMSEEVRRRVELQVLDNLGTLAYTSRLADVDAYIDRLREKGGAPEATVWGRNFRIPVEDAAAANAFLIHAAETDDSDFRASLRASPVVMAPALTLAEARQVSGRQFLTAVAIGYTVLGRVAAPVGPTQGTPGLMSAGVWGPTSTAAIAAFLSELDAEQTTHAIALAAGSGGGSFQYFYDQTEEKRLVVARAARNGVEAALLAAAGMVGPPGIFEGPAGVYYNLSAGRAYKLDPAPITANFDALEGPLHIYPKLFSASASILPTLEALDEVWRAKGLTAEEVRGFTLKADPRRARVLAPKLEHFEPPRTIIGAKINFAFALALYMVHGDASVHEFTEDVLDDEDILALARKARYVPLPDSREFVLELELVSGERIEVRPRTSDGRSTEPLVLDQRMRKFASLTRDALTDADRAELIRLVETLHEVQDMADWTRRVNAIITDPRFQNETREQSRD